MGINPLMNIYDVPNSVFMMSPSQLIVLCSQSLLLKLGYYKIILFTFVLEAVMAVVMFVLGPQHYYLMAFFLTASM